MQILEGNKNGSSLHFSSTHTGELHWVLSSHLHPPQPFANIWGGALCLLICCLLCLSSKWILKLRQIKKVFLVDCNELKPLFQLGWRWRVPWLSNRALSFAKAKWVTGYLFLFQNALWRKQPGRCVPVNISWLATTYGQEDSFDHIYN